jgi:DNA polymerase-4
MDADLLAARLCCLDLDTFFVSVERLLDPSLVGKPVIVGWTGGRGVVTSCSYEVRTYGVRSGMPMAEALRLAPRAIVVNTRHGAYGEYAERVRTLIEAWCPVVQTASIDEFFLDFRGCERLFGRPDEHGDATVERHVREMRQAVQDEIGLPASAGIGRTRAIAKMASGRAKPAGVWMVRGGEERAFVDPLPVRKFPGIGPVTEQRLAEDGLRRLGELMDSPTARWRGLAESVRRACDPDRIQTLGRDRPAFQEHDPEGEGGGLSNECTFHEDLSDPLAIEKQLRALAERVCWRVRKRGTRARTVTVKLRYSDFHTITRGRTIAATDRETDVLGCALALVREGRTRTVPIRLLGIRLSNFVGPDQQVPLPFAEPRRPAVGRAIDAVRRRFGYDAVRLGTTQS